MIPETQIISIYIYCDIDNFCKEIDEYVENGLVKDKKQQNGGQSQYFQRVK